MPIIRAPALQANASPVDGTGGTEEICHEQYGGQ